MKLLLFWTNRKRTDFHLLMIVKKRLAKHEYGSPFTAAAGGVLRGLQSGVVPEYGRVVTLSTPWKILNFELNQWMVGEEFRESTAIWFHFNCEKEPKPKGSKANTR